MFCEPANTNKVEGVKHYNFQEKFDCPVFTNKFVEPVLDRFKRRKKDKDGNYQWMSTSVANKQKGHPNQKWLEEHTLTHMSQPFDYFHAFCSDF